MEVGEIKGVKGAVVHERKTKLEPRQQQWNWRGEAKKERDLESKRKYCFGPLSLVLRFP